MDWEGLGVLVEVGLQARDGLGVLLVSARPGTHQQ